MQDAGACFSPRSGIGAPSTGGATHGLSSGPRHPGPVLTVPLLARGVGPSSGDALIRPELPA